MVRGKSRKSGRGRALQAAVVLYLLCTGLITVLPVMTLFAKAFSSDTGILSGEVFLLPKGFQTESARFILSQKDFLRSLCNSGLVTVFGTLMSFAVTTCGAYPLSKKDLPGRRWLTLLIVFTMLFSGGLIPTYIVVKDLHLMDSLWALMLPTLVNPFYFVIMKNYFESLPDSLEEAAKIEGCSYYQILCKIVLPLSLPIVATILVYYSVLRWNAYFEPMLYISSRNHYTVQLYIDQLTKMFDTPGLLDKAMLKGMTNKTPQVIQSAAIFLSMLPIALVYPFVQKYFVTGVMLGAEKG